MKTRDKILQIALGLFNEQGVPNVTLRKIAGKMFISQGNLNYHFKHREDIIEALFLQLIETFEIEKTKLDSEEQMDFQFLIDSTRNEMETLFKFRFFMIDFNQNMRENPKLHEQFKQLEETRRTTYLQIFDLAIKAGVMRAPAFEGEYNGLNERIRVFSDYWIASAEVYNEPIETTVDKYHNLLVEMFFAYFTKDSQREFLLKRL
jgi:AcrR family transcriptional regulator